MPVSRRHRGRARDHSSRPPTAALPDLYQAWIDALLGGPIEAESEATCDSCAMLAPAHPQPATDLFFDPRVKCCTYVPSLPNFIVGRILCDRSRKGARGRASVEARIATGEGVTPAGLAQPPSFVRLYRNAQQVFGREVAMRCPHYLPDHGSCGIWRHRQSVCSTWFCKHVRGAAGQRFWTSLRRLLEAVERSLSAHCIRSLDPGVAAFGRTVRAPGPPGDSHRRSPWGRRYVGREREFYRAAARIVDRLSWKDILRISGPETRRAARVLRRQYKALQSTTVPSRLRVAATVVPIDRHFVRMTGYSATDPLVVPRALSDVLHYFDGRSTQSALVAIAASGLDLDRATVRRLVDFELLVPAGAKSPAVTKKSQP